MSEVDQTLAESTGIPAESQQQRNNIEAIEAKRLQLLDEKKKISSENAELKARLEAIENDKLESQGKYADINKSLKDKLSEVEKKLQDTTKTYAYASVTSVIKQKALEMGAVNADKVLKLMDKSDLELITIDDNFKPDIDAINMVLEKMKKENEDIGLFKRNVPATKDVTPNSSYFQQPKQGSKNKTLAELKEDYKKLKLSAI